MWWCPERRWCLGLACFLQPSSPCSFFICVLKYFQTSSRLLWFKSRVGECAYLQEERDESFISLQWNFCQWGCCLKESTATRSPRQRVRLRERGCQQLQGWKKRQKNFPPSRAGLGSGKYPERVAPVRPKSSFLWATWCSSFRALLQAPVHHQ